MTLQRLEAVKGGIRGVEPGGARAGLYELGEPGFERRFGFRGIAGAGLVRRVSRRSPSLRWLVPRNPVKRENTLRLRPSFMAKVGDQTAPGPGRPASGREGPVPGRREGRLRGFGAVRLNAQYPPHH